MTEFVAGKKYTDGNIIVYCVGHNQDGVPVFENSNGLVGVATAYKAYGEKTLVEYQEPRHIYEVVSYGRFFRDRGKAEAFVQDKTFKDIIEYKETSR